MKKYYIDIETYEKKDDGLLHELLDTNKFVIGCMIEDTGEEYVYYDKIEMKNAILNILRSGTNIGIFGHNLEYDFYGIFKDELKELINTEELNIIRSRVMLGIFNKNNYFLDTMAFFPMMSVADIGELLGSPKEERKPTVKDPKELAEYCMQDVRILKLAMEKLEGLMKELDYRPRKVLTIGDLAIKLLMKYIRKSGKAGYYMREGHMIMNKDNIAFIREASKGGRVEVFAKGEFKSANQIDINSAYWKAMKEMPFPDLLKERRYKKDVIDKLGYDKILEYIGVVRCTIKTSGKGVGVLPIRTNLISKMNYKLEFPNNGEILRGYWTTYEVNEAIKRGYELKEIEECVIYTKCLSENILSRFVDDLWALRKKHYDDKFSNKIIKTIGNSLYGKFLQKTTRKKYKWIERRELEEHMEKGWEVESGIDDYCISMELEEYIPRHLSVIMGVLITSYSRIRLLEVLEKLEKPIYTDTDGIIFEDRIDEKEMNIGDELGQFKIEHENEECYVLREKGYYIGNDIKLSRIQKEHRTKENIRNGANVEIEQPEMFSLTQAMKTGEFDKIGTFTKKKTRLIKKNE